MLHGNIKENESDLDLGLQKDYMLKRYSKYKSLGVMFRLCGNHFNSNLKNGIGNDSTVLL